MLETENRKCTMENVEYGPLTGPYAVKHELGDIRD